MSQYFLKIIKIDVTKRLNSIFVTQLFLNFGAQYASTKSKLLCLFALGLSVMGINDSEVTDIFRLVAGILHIGNIQFAENGNYSQVADKQCKYCRYFTGSSSVATLVSGLHDC